MEVKASLLEIFICLVFMFEIKAIVVVLLYTLKQESKFKHILWYILKGYFYILRHFLY